MMETYLALGFPVGALLLAVCWRYLDRRIERLEHQRTQELKAANVLGVYLYSKFEKPYIPTGIAFNAVELLYLAHSTGSGRPDKVHFRYAILECPEVWSLFQNALFRATKTPPIKHPWHHRLYN